MNTAEIIAKTIKYSKPIIEADLVVENGIIAGVSMAKLIAEDIQHLQDGNPVAQSILDALPWFAIVRGTFHVIDGLATMVEDGRVEDREYFKYTPLERNIRGGFQALSGFLLVADGIASLAHLSYHGIAASTSLFGVYAFNAWVEFGKAMHDVYLLITPPEKAKNNTDLGKDEHQLRRFNTVTKKDISPYKRRNIIFNAIVKGFAAAGWTALAFGGPVGLAIGSGCLALSAIFALVQHRYRFEFLVNWAKPAAKPNERPTAEGDRPHTPSPEHSPAI